MISTSVRIVPIMLILKPKLQYFSVFLLYFASKISTSTEESVRLEALGEQHGLRCMVYMIFWFRRPCHQTYHLKVILRVRTLLLNTVVATYPQRKGNGELMQLKRRLWVLSYHLRCESLHLQNWNWRCVHVSSLPLFVGSRTCPGLFHQQPPPNLPMWRLNMQVLPVVPGPQQELQIRLVSYLCCLKFQHSVKSSIVCK